MKRWMRIMGHCGTPARLDTARNTTCRHSGTIAGSMGDGTRLRRQDAGANIGAAEGPKGGPQEASSLSSPPALRRSIPGSARQQRGQPRNDVVWLRGRGHQVGVCLTALLVLTLAGCERGMHEMYQQPKYKPLTPSPLFPDGNSSRPQVDGTVPHSAGALAGTTSGRDGAVKPLPSPGPAVGVDAKGKPLAQAGRAAEPGYSNPLTITPTLLARGRERFNIYCAPCHSRAGDGDGMIARRGFPHPPSYHTDRLRNAPDSHFYQVIANGYGIMYPYADRITPHDRWAIVAYIRALQLSQHAPVADLGPTDLAKLKGATK